MSAKSNITHKPISDSVEPSWKNTCSGSSLGFSHDEMWAELNGLWPLILLLDTRYRPVPNRFGVITPTHQVITPGLLLLFLLSSSAVAQERPVCLALPASHA